MSRRLSRAAVPLCVVAGSCIAALPAQQPRQARNCVIDIDSAGRVYQHGLTTGGALLFAGGGVLAHCRGQAITMQSDSVEWFSERSELHLLGRAHFRDSTELLDADRVTYWTRQERLYADGNVVTRNVKTRSEMRGPNLDYYRAVPPVRDTLELSATGRPTIHLYRTADSTAADTTNPFVVIADRVKLRHTDRFWGSGRVTIDRRDLHASADSAFLNLADSLAWLIGAPQVVGVDTTRPRTDTTSAYRLTGQRIRFALNGRQDITGVRSNGDADALGPDWHLTADTIDMDVDSNKIQRAQAWGRERRPVATSGLSTIVADSLDIHMPAQVMRLVWAYVRAQAVSKPDSIVVENDWLSGDSLRATFTPVDSAGTTRSEVDRVIAYGSARAFYHTENSADPSGARGINYSRGDRINIAMHERKVRTVDIVGKVDGVYLEPLPPPVDTARRDTTHADSNRAGPARVAPPSAAPATPRRSSPPAPATARPGAAPAARGRSP